MEIGEGRVIKCNYELCVKVVNKSHIQSEPLFKVTLPGENIQGDSEGVTATYGAHF
jgi:hypothetical protein